MMRLVLEEVLEEGSRVLAEIDGTSKIGRDLMTDIPVSSGALSRQHGIFLPFTTGWVFKDLGSTNGSWQNGSKIEVQRLVALKEGDYLQLADIIIKVRYTGERTGDIGPRFFIVREGEALGEFPLRSADAVLSVGGNGGQLQLDGYAEAEPAVQFTVNGSKVMIEPRTDRIPIRLNNQAVSTASRVSKGDYLVVGEYEFLLVEGSLARGHAEPKPLMASLPRPEAPQTDLTAVSDRKSKEPEQKPQIFSPAHTVAIHADRQKILKFGETAGEEDEPWHSKPQQRTIAPVTEKQSFFDFDSMTETERRLVMGILFFLGSSVFLFLIWLVFL